MPHSTINQSSLKDPIRLLLADSRLVHGLHACPDPTRGVLRPRIAVFKDSAPVLVPAFLCLSIGGFIPVQVPDNLKLN